MKQFVSLAASLMIGLGVAGCASPPRNQPIAESDFNFDYGYRQADRSDQVLAQTFVVATFSGGGSRAGALAEGMLREFAATPLPSGRSLVDEIDLISSVSGGSVTAANFALYGTEGFAHYEEKYLRTDLMAPLVLGVVNPLNWPRSVFTSYSRIDVFVELLNDVLFHDRTFADLQAQRGRPYLILNAADMTSGSRFQFTQRTFDLLCSDLSRLPIADAVAASAAFPAGLTPITLTNYSPCPAQRKNSFQISDVMSDQQEDGYGDGAVDEQQMDDVVFVDVDDTLPIRNRGMREGRMLNVDGQKSYVHLLDGGIADNLGLAEPLSLASGDVSRDGAPPPNTSDYVFVVVNARSDPASDRDLSSSTPGIPAMLLSSVNAAIDGRTGGLQSQLTVLESVVRAGAREPGARSVSIISVDFDLIRDADCRQAFFDIVTTWALDARTIDSLMEMGSAMVLASPAYHRLASSAGAAMSGTTSKELSALAQARARQACTRLRDPELPLPDVTFGWQQALR